jgi:hypothetical protein
MEFFKTYTTLYFQEFVLTVLNPTLYWLFFSEWNSENFEPFLPQGSDKNVQIWIMFATSV